MKTRVLVLCHGNKYRSPLCAAIIARNLELEVRSAGFYDEGTRAAKPVREYAASIGLDLSEHRSALLDYTRLQWANIIIYMDNGNLSRLQDLYRRCDPNIRRVPAICLGAFASPPHSRIPDPVMMKDREFDKVMALIKQASEHVMTLIPSLVEDNWDRTCIPAVSGGANKKGRVRVQTNLKTRP